MASPPPLTIRNLTSTCVEIKRVERYRDESQSRPESFGSLPNASANDVLKQTLTSFKSMSTSLTRSLNNLTSSNSNSTATPPVPESAAPSSIQEVSIRIEPFCCCVSDIKSADGAANEVVRFAFESEGETHQVDTPSPSNASTTSKPLTPNPRLSFTAVYLPTYAFLALFSSADLASWMSRLKDVTPLSALSIPGTHNSAAYYTALPSVRCQAVSVPEQLENGVRFLDVRVQPEDPEDGAKDGLILVHGVFPISLTGRLYFRELVNDVLAFLDRHPSETVIMSVKREGPGTHNDAQLSRRLRDHYAGDVERWFTAPRIPTLGEARRKIVLMRRFALDDTLQRECDGQGWCINAERWAYNTPNDTCPSGDICVQDFCEVLETENINAKVQYCEAHLDRAACTVCPLPDDTHHHDTTTTTSSSEALSSSSSPTKFPPFYINFLSASNFWKVGCWPERIAAKLNPAIIDYLCRRHASSSSSSSSSSAESGGDGSTGIVVCDWVGKDADWDLVRCVVGWNAKLELKEKRILN